MKLHVTLDQRAYATLERHAKQAQKPCTRVAREILLEGLAQRDAAARRKKLAADYCRVRRRPSLAERSRSAAVGVVG